MVHTDISTLKPRFSLAENRCSICIYSSFATLQAMSNNKDVYYYYSVNNLPVNVLKFIVHQLNITCTYTNNKVEQLEYNHTKRNPTKR